MVRAHTTRVGPSVFVALIALYSATMTFAQNRTGFRIPEEATMLDYSVFLKAFEFSSEVRKQIAYSLQWTTLIPWGVISKISFNSDLSTVSHFSLIFFLRHFSLQWQVFRVIKLKSQDVTAAILSCALMTLPPIRMGIFYSHWWSHIMLFCGLFLALVTPAESIKRWTFQNGMLIALTVSVWTNLPHMIAAWLGVPLAMLFNHLTKRPRLSTEQFRSLFTTALVLYIVPLVTTLNSLDVFMGAPRETFHFFRSLSTLKAVQGFGNWWLFDRACLNSICVHYDPTMFEHFKGFRSAVRLLIPATVIFYFFIVTSNEVTSNSVGRKRKLDAASSLAIISMITFGLSVVANSNWYKKVLDWLPSMFSLFREPYPKFGTLYVVFLYTAFAAIVGQLKGKVLYSFELLLAIAVVWAVVPEFNRNVANYGPSVSRFGFVSNLEWNELDEDVKSIQPPIGRFCVVSDDSPISRAVLALLSLKNPDRFTDLSVLRPLSITDGIVSQGKSVDLPNTCNESSASLLVIGENISQIANFSNFYSCEQVKSKYFKVYSPRCLATFNLKFEDNLIVTKVPISEGNFSSIYLKGRDLWFRRGTDFKLQVNTEILRNEKVELEIVYFSRRGIHGSPSFPKTYRHSYIGDFRLETPLNANCINVNEECWYVLSSIGLRLID